MPTQAPFAAAADLAAEPASPSLDWQRRQRRGRAACGRTKAEGAALRQCAGCGSLTGVRHCSQRCCRDHWCEMSRRAECEAAQAAKRLMAPHGGAGGSSGGNNDSGVCN
ncbi:hypothetical protein MNEG_0860 [Monoraphidium neglectum]|uniref:MYND-type domain-containing protein n=1 Tax=Monoraphidium neglectum TaxID=145388 RepID=A0A0D2MX67_9CHLO|nr:hypothetical protein MNEG_0860 [Monoraphidium neglectum]KIZ07090.1 hypothetical protein MNEG_0860 [Monoraphidium neglectum]|eukprot:XP_013906109.1 hypothetical protein MNEG_0860 [Monoraphidium neglectum]